MKQIIGLCLLVSAVALGIRSMRKVSRIQTSLLAAVNAEVVVVGSGPTGLATAIMLAKNGYKEIKLFDQLSEPAEPGDHSFWGKFDSTRTYNIGISGRGRKVLEDLGAFIEVEKATAAIKYAITWSPASPIDQPAVREMNSTTYPTVCLDRDRLTACLLKILKDSYADRVTVEFDAQCTGIVFADGLCEVSIQAKGARASEGNLPRVVTSRLVIGADGTGSRVRDEMSKVNNKVELTTFKDNNVRLYRTIPLRPPTDALSVQSLLPDVACVDCSYSARSRIQGAEVNLEALPTKEGTHLGVVLFRPNDPHITAIRSASDAKAFFYTHFPMMAPLLRIQDLERFASASDSRFQRFQYAGPELHVDSRAVLVGDSVHTVKPYFGFGVNAALEDVLVLQQALRRHNCTGEGATTDPAAMQAALKQYSQLRYPEGKAMVEISLRFDKGLVQFLLPFIVDKFLHGRFPRLFSAPVLRQLQDETKSFTGVQRAKRRERVVQAGLLMGSAAGAWWGTRWLISVLQRCKRW